MLGKMGITGGNVAGMRSQDVPGKGETVQEKIKLSSLSVALWKIKLPNLFTLVMRGEKNLGYRGWRAGRGSGEFGIPWLGWEHCEIPESWRALVWERPQSSSWGQGQSPGCSCIPLGLLLDSPGSPWGCSWIPLDPPGAPQCPWQCSRGSSPCLDSLPKEHP